MPAKWEWGSLQLKTDQRTTTTHVEPDGLSPRSTALWRQLVAAGRVKSPGRATLLEQAFRALDLSDAARAERIRDGLTIVNTTTGLRHVNPVCRVEKDALATFASCWKALGLTWDAKVDGGGL
jgi:phage terminase small subunit